MTDRDNDGKNPLPLMPFVHDGADQVIEMWRGVYARRHALRDFETVAAHEEVPLALPVYLDEPPPVHPGLHPAYQQAAFNAPSTPAEELPLLLALPEILKAAILTFVGKTEEGQLVAAVGNAWLRILDALLRDPTGVMQMSPRQMEEFIAGCYDHDGYEVTLTPRSADLGRDVIATKKGVGVIRILDQVKRYKPGHLVTAEEVRAFLFVAQNDRASKAFITTTSGFAPNLMKDKLIAPYISTLLDLRGRMEVIDWLGKLKRGK